MTTQEPSGARESFTEWGVRWSDDESVTVRGSEQDARKWLGVVGPIARTPRGVVVCRTVAYTEWLAADSGGRP